MFRSSGSVFCVVVMAAFVFGCGGGGGGTTTGGGGTMPGPAEPTDAERIADAQRMVESILTAARTRAETARLTANSLQSNPDATAAQITNANNHSTAAQAALRLIESENTAAMVATTPDAAQTALTNARAAQNTLNTEASAIASIQSAVQAVTTARNQREMDERALTNNSSLIQHLRDNKLLSDAVLGVAGANLTAGSSATDGSIRVGAANNPGDITGGARTACAEPCAEYPATTMTTAGGRVTGQRTVRLQGLVSDSTTPTLTGTGRLPHGFDLKNATNTTFVNAYTDIRQERQVARNDVDDDVATTPYDERYDYSLDTDYLLAGIWMTVDNANLSASSIVAFAYGNQPIATADFSFCAGNDGTAGGVTTTTTSAITIRTCGATSGVNLISNFVDDGKDFTATYQGNANGTYLAGSNTSYFTGDVTLTAEFQNPTGGTEDGSGSIVGEVTNIDAGGQSMAGSIELQKQTFGNAIHAAFVAGAAVGVVDDKSFSGAWKGQFFGMRHKPKSTMRDVDTATTPDTTTITTTYRPDAPGSVAGTFYATQQSNPAGEAAFIGAFGAHR